MIRGDARCLADIDVVVLAGGLGTRLAAVLSNRPKLLAPVCGRPFVEILIDWLARFGARRVVFALGHLAHEVERHLDSHARPGLAFARVVESSPLGTAGALRLAAAQCHTDPVMVINGDSLVDADLCAFVATHRHVGAAISLICAEIDDVSRYGRVEIGSNYVRRFVEKDSHYFGPGFINAGVYLISALFLKQIAEGGARSLEHDVFARLPAGTARAFAGRFRFIDIGTPASLAAAADMMANIESGAS